MWSISFPVYVSGKNIDFLTHQFPVDPDDVCHGLSYLIPSSNIVSIRPSIWLSAGHIEVDEVHCSSDTFRTYTLHNFSSVIRRMLTDSYRLIKTYFERNVVWFSFCDFSAFVWQLTLFFCGLLWSVCVCEVLTVDFSLPSPLFLFLALVSAKRLMRTRKEVKSSLTRFSSIRYRRLCVWGRRLSLRIYVRAKRFLWRHTVHSPKRIARGFLHYL